MEEWRTPLHGERTAHENFYLGDGFRMKRTLLLPGVIAVVMGLVFAAAWGVPRLQARSALDRAADLRARGFTALALEALRPHEEALSRTAEGCRELSDLIFQAGEAVSLQATAERCLSNGVQTPEVVIGLAASRELRNDDQTALNILNGALKQFKESPDLPFRMGVILRRNKNTEGAANAFSLAASLAPKNAQLQLNIVRILAELEAWKKAAEAAARIKDEKTEDPEVKLVLARVFLRAGDSETARQTLGSAKSLLSRVDDNRSQQLRRAYEDVFAIESGSDGPDRLAPGPNVAKPGSPAPSERMPASPPFGGGQGR